LVISFLRRLLKVYLSKGEYFLIINLSLRLP
jgi:hypothetical protein